LQTRNIARIRLALWSLAAILALIIYVANVESTSAASTDSSSKRDYDTTMHAQMLRHAQMEILEHKRSEAYKQLLLKLRPRLCASDQQLVDNTIR
jgi:hypothetical protein